MSPNNTSPYSIFTSDLQTNILIQNDYILSGVLVWYVVFVKFVGPSFMKNRKPMDLQILMLLYNGFLVAANAYASLSMTLLALKLWPHRCDIRNSFLYTETWKFYPLAWIILFVKFAELVDTIIFVLRKKFQQVSFLHVFHHTVVCTLAWISTKYISIAYFGVLAVAINCTVHVLLYTYYALSALGPSVSKYLWWKRYLTRIQIMQFFAVLLYVGCSWLVGCEEPDALDRAILGFVSIVTVLFLNFYYRTYKIKTN